MRDQLSGGQEGSSAEIEMAPEIVMTDEDFGARRRSGPLLPTPAGSAPSAAVIAAQTWLAKAEDAVVDAAVSRSSC